MKRGITHAVLEVLAAAKNANEGALKSTEIHARALALTSRAYDVDYVRRRVLERGQRDGWAKQSDEDAWELSGAAELIGQAALTREARVARQRAEATGTGRIPA